ncbi:MAG: MerR family transcriptional regulator [Oscillospiraceae bacterium]|nr:MerR family transcriptional regulator [Oscillospiraceae bacterium]
MNETTRLSIKEFSEFTGISQYTLRYYDEIGLLPAASRSENNYRQYTPFQIIKLNYINVLVDLGVPLSVIKDMNKSRTPESVLELLRQQEVELNLKLHELWKSFSIIDTYRKNVQDGLAAQGGVIRVEDVGDTHYVLGYVNDFTEDHLAFYDEFIRFCQSAGEYRINLRYPIGGLHEDMNSFLNAPGWPTRFFSLDPLGNNNFPKGKYLVAYNLGYYGDFGDTPQKMAAYALEHDLVFKGHLYTVYLLDEISTIEPDQYLSRTAVGVSPKKNRNTDKR